MKKEMGRLCIILIMAVLLIVIITQACLIAEMARQVNLIRADYNILTKKVENHERIMRAYEFYNWHYSLQMLGEEGNESDN